MSKHDMQNTNPPLPPLPPEITQLLSGLDAAQWAWLSEDSLGKSRKRGIRRAARASEQHSPTAEPNTVTVLSASQASNAKSVADKASESLEAKGIQVRSAELKDYKTKNIADEHRLLLVTSTQTKANRRKKPSCCANC